MHSDFWFITIFLSVAAVVCTCAVMRSNHIRSHNIELINNNLDIISGNIVDPGMSNSDGSRILRFKYWYNDSLYEATSLRVIGCSGELSSEKIREDKVGVALDSTNPINSILVLTKADYDIFSSDIISGVRVYDASEICEPLFSD